MIEVSFAHAVITPRFNIEYNLDIGEKVKFAIPMTADSVLNLGSLSLASRVSNYYDYLSNSVIIIFALVDIFFIA